MCPLRLKLGISDNTTDLVSVQPIKKARDDASGHLVKVASASFSKVIFPFQLSIFEGGTCLKQFFAF